MRANGKIYVVVAVAAIVIAVTGIYMISIDRKVSRLEKRLKDKN
jgi:CcmD family protein